MRNEPIDFIGVDYDVGNRRVEETILPLAQERKIGVMAFFPFGNNAESVAAVGTQPLRARRHHAPSGVGRRVRRQDLGAVLPQVRHQPPGRHRGPCGDDQGDAHARQHRRRHRPPAERGDAEAHGGVHRCTPRASPPQRGRHPRHAAPGIALSAAILDRYVGEYKAASGFTATFRRDGTRCS